jgi:hypothetical protein
VRLRRQKLRREDALVFDATQERFQERFSREVPKEVPLDSRRASLKVLSSILKCFPPGRILLRNGALALPL